MFFASKMYHFEKKIIFSVTLESPCGAGTTFKGYFLKVDYAELNHTNGSLGSFDTPAGSKSICEVSLQF